jgi:5-methylcytosine-specific restriction endonuclease McrA
VRSRKSLIKEADRVFSLFIRNRGARFGWNNCFTCGAYLTVEELQCGHFRPRRYLNTRWHPFNCWPQCNTCNVEKNGNLVKYEAKLVALYGQDAVDGIYYLSHENTGGLTDHEIKEIIDKYKP